MSRFRFDFLAFLILLSGLGFAGVVFLQPDPDNLTVPVWLPLPLLFVHDFRVTLFESLGAALSVLVAGWLILAVQFCFTPDRRHWLTKVPGWLLLVLISSLAADRLTPLLPGTTLYGSGGSIGSLGLLLLHYHLHPAGVGLLCGGMFLLGMILAADPIVFGTVHGVSLALTKTLGLLAGLVRLLSAPKIEKVPAKPSRSSPKVIPQLVRDVPSTAPVIPETPDDIPITHIETPLPLIEKEPPIPAQPAEIPITRLEPPVPSKLPKPVKVSGPAFVLPSMDLLDDPQPFPFQKHDEQLREVATLLEKTCQDFNINLKVVGIHTGPVVTQYEVALETGLRLSKVTALADDLALNLRVPSVRIVPLSNRTTLGIEVPNEHRAIVRMKELSGTGAAKIAKCKLPLLLGKDSEGNPLIYDLAEMPHLLVAGRTGTGKSVCLNTMILSMLLTRTPDECRLIMIDPKKVELAEYASLPHLMCPVVTENSKAEAVLAWAVQKMEERYELLKRSKVRNISGFNELSREEILKRTKPENDEVAKKIPEKMPYIVIVVDEVGDLMMEMKKEVEGHIIRLAQKSRAAGIHLILTTQRPTVDVITGLIKSNLPARICFQVTNRTDSRVVLDEMGAEKLLGKGDMLFLQPNTSTIVRAQGTYASDQEITRVVSMIECEAPVFEAELMQIQEKPKDSDEKPTTDTGKHKDELYEAAIEIVLKEQRGSCSLLQRAMGIGYGRAARLIDFMAEDGLVGTYNGAQAREVLLTLEEWQARRKSAA